ncbi:anti-sigma B factor RsbW [Paenibacillus sp. HB172176]|uniref:anti-sigma B factor RsbW n=1 Tax=Paenibacillus sp. HB172176 TaxID=2493690 RepID=UPI001439F518|nr:anti-sigma B factor RsbW [Paenibacillus sp. HB172176]
MKAIQLQIPAEAENIDLVRICLYGVANKLGFSYEDIEDMKVAVSEACSNAVIHGSSDRGADGIWVRFQTDESTFAISIINKGGVFPYEEVRSQASPIQASETSELKVGGLGIYLMEALMDEVAVNTTEQGTEVVLTKYRSKKGDL